MGVKGATTEINGTVVNIQDMLVLAFHEFVFLHDERTKHVPKRMNIKYSI